MSRTITEYQVRVFEYARNHLGTWFTIQELATETNIPAGSAKGRADRFHDRGLFELLKISPAQVYRMTEESIASDPELVRRIEQAIPIFAQRRQGWLQREAARIGAVSDSVAAPDVGDALARTTPVDTDSSSQAASTPSATRRAADASSIGHDRQSRTPKRNSKPRRPTKGDELIALLQRPTGASLDELIDYFGTQPHSIRALISVSTRERGLKAQLEDGRYTLL